MPVVVWLWVRSWLWDVLPLYVPGSVPVVGIPRKYLPSRFGTVTPLMVLPLHLVQPAGGAAVIHPKIIFHRGRASAAKSLAVRIPLADPLGRV